MIKSSSKRILDMLVLLDADTAGKAYIVKNRFTSHKGYVSTEIVNQILEEYVYG